MQRSVLSRRRMAAAITGLAIAWGGTALLISPAARVLGEPARLQTDVIGLAVLWLLAASIVAIVLFWEREPIASLWLQPPRWSSVGWGLFFVAVNYAILFPVGQWIRRAAGLPGFAGGMEQVMTLPLGYRALAVITAGIVEELLFRGYTVTRLTMLTGRTWLAAALALAGFSALHVPLWGWGFAAGGLVGGAAAMAFFVWRRDLLAMMIFHTITDATGLLIAPAISDWWKDPSLA